MTPMICPLSSSIGVAISARTSGPDADVTRIGGDVGHQLFPAMERHPARDALPEAQGKFLGVRRHAPVNLDLQFAGVGVEQRDRTRRGAKRLDGNGEDGAEGLARVVDFADEGADAVEAIGGYRIPDTGYRIDGKRGRVIFHGGQF